MKKFERLPTSKYRDLETKEIVDRDFFDKIPVCLIYYDYGKSSLLSGVYEYLHYGSLHREDGPAVIYFDQDGSISDREYWLNGFLELEEVWFKKISKISKKSAINHLFNLGLFSEKI